MIIDKNHSRAANVRGGCVYQSKQGNKNRLPSIDLKLSAMAADTPVSVGLIHSSSVLLKKAISISLSPDQFMLAMSVVS